MVFRLKPRSRSASRVTSWRVTIFRDSVWAIIACRLSDIVEDAAAAILGQIAQQFFDPQQLIVLGDPVGTADRTGFDLAGADGHDDIGDGGCLRFRPTDATRPP